MSGMDRLTEREWLISLLTIEQEQMLTDYEVHPDAWRGDPERADSTAALADGILDGIAHRRASQAAHAPSDGLREENERLREAVLRDAKRRMADLTEWLNEDYANPILLRHAVDAADLEFLRAAISASPAQEGGE